MGIKNYYLVILLFVILYFQLTPSTFIGFVCEDPKLSHKYTGDTVGNYVILVGCPLFALLSIFLVEYLKNNTPKRKIWLCFKEYIVGFILLLFIIEFIKRIVQEPRPHFLHVCMPVENQNCEIGQYIDKFTCSNNEFNARHHQDSVKSFPSGHAATSVFTSMFIAYIIGTGLETKNVGYIFKTFLIILSIFFGVFCSFSRVYDKRHHWWDVLFGMTLGISYAVYILYFLHKCICKSIK